MKIVFIEFDGADRPFQVYTSDLQGYDFYLKNGSIDCNWCSGNIRPFLSQFAKPPKRKRKIWFDEEFRPTFSSGNTPLTNKEIADMGYVIIPSPKHIIEITNLLP